MQLESLAFYAVRLVLDPSDAEGVSSVEQPLARQDTIMYTQQVLRTKNLTCLTSHHYRFDGAGRIHIRAVDCTRLQICGGLVFVA